MKKNVNTIKRAGNKPKGRKGHKNKGGNHNVAININVGEHNSNVNVNVHINDPNDGVEISNDDLRDFKRNF